MAIKQCVVCGKDFEARGSAKACCAEHARRRRLDLDNERSRLEYAVDPKKFLSRGKKWRASNSEKQSAYNKARKGKNIVRDRELKKKWRDANRAHVRAQARERSRKLFDLIAVLRSEKPELLKEFGL